jgi:hypothetical protein
MTVQVCRRAGISLAVFDEPAEADGPGKGALHNRAPGQQHVLRQAEDEGRAGLGQLHDLKFDAVLARRRSRLPAGVTPIDEGDLDAVVGGYPASTRFTDRLLGSLANKLPGSPSIQSVTASQRHRRVLRLWWEGERLRPVHHQSAVEHHSGQWHQHDRIHAGAVASILLGLQRHQRGATRLQPSPTRWTMSRFSASSTRRRRTGSSGCRAAFSTGLSSTSAGSSCLSCAAALGVERRRSSRLFGGRTAGITGRRKPALDWWHQFSDLRLTLQCARGYPDLWRLGQSADPLHPQRSDQSRFQPGNGRFHAVRHQHRREGLSP